MTTVLDPAIVRIRSANSRVVGAGFLVGERQVLTCAHVVAQALGTSDAVSEPSKAEVRLDFPLVAPSCTLAARVVFWQPSQSDGRGDIGGLELQDVPSCAQPVQLVKAQDLWGHAFRTFGLPAGHDAGVWASGVLRGRTADGWVLIEDVKQPGYPVQPGFSGGPVWDEQLNGVVGMTVAADTQRETKAAFMIPSSLLVKAWPLLAERSLEVNSLAYLRYLLAVFEAAQQQAPNPRRFQARIDELRTAIAGWGERVENQQQRIADGLDAQCEQMISKTQEHSRRRVKVAGRPPDVMDYFKNRERELAEIEGLLAEPATRLVSIIGHGGIGKTALASKVLGDLERHCWPHTTEDIPLDGMAYLSTHTAGISLERIFRDCARILDGKAGKRLNAVWTNPKQRIEDKVTHLSDTLNSGRYLILLDGLEDLLDDSGQLVDPDLQLFFEHSLTASGGAQLLATSRVALAFRRELMRFDRHVRLLEGLPVSDSIAFLRELDPNGDCGLRDAPEWQLTEAVKVVHGVPRALEVLVSILANDPFATLAEVLDRFYEQQDVARALIEENYKRIDSSARRVIEALAVFKRPVPPLAVDYLLEPFVPGLDVPGIIRRLTRTNIVRVDRAAKLVTLHPIDQDYAYSQLPEEKTGESAYTRQALERRAACYYVQLHTPPETWKSIDDLESQLMEFEHRVRAGDYDAAAWVLELIGDNHLYPWGYYARLVEMRESLLEQLADPGLRMTNAGGLGKVLRALGQVKRAAELFEESLVIAREIDDRQSECVWLSYLGGIYRDLGQVGRAIEFQKIALAIAREIGNRQSEALCLSGLGFAYRNLGQVEQSTEFYEQSLAIACEIGDQRRESDCLGNMGNAYRILGQFEQAIELYKEALLIAREIGHRRFEILWLSNLGLVNYSLGRIEQAIRFHTEALEIAREIGERSEESYQLLWLGRALLVIEEFSEAQKHCVQAASLSVPHTSYRAALMRGIVLLHQGDPLSVESFADAISRCRDLLDNTADLYRARYALAATLVGQAICNPRWADESERASLLAPALVEYRRALEITAAPGVVSDVIQDVELVQAAGIEGLEPVLQILKANPRESAPLA